MLTAALSDLTRGATHTVAAAAVDRTSAVPWTACVNGDLDRVFEIGSITKALTGMLLADMVGRDEVTLETSLGELLPRYAGKALGSVTVRELCTHTSGLPRLPRSPALFGRAILGQLTGTDPYRNPSVTSVLDSAGRQALRGRGNYRYSNLGGAVLGQGLAARAGQSGTGQSGAGQSGAGQSGAGQSGAGQSRAGQAPVAADYAAVLTERILAPLGMTTATVADAGHAAQRGWSAGGRRQQPWLLGGYAPAGGVIATIGDMARLAARLVDGSAPGIAALDPVEPTNPLESVDPERSVSGARRSGMFWVVDPGPTGGESITWHNGMTGGYSAIIRIRRGAGTAIVVLSEVADGARVAALARDLEESLFGGGEPGGHDC